MNAAWASTETNADVVRFLVERGATIDACTIRKANTALCGAAAVGNLDVVHALIHKKAELDHANSDGNTPLWLAAQQGKLEIVQALASAGADIDHRNHTNTTPLEAAMSSNRGSVVSFLLGAGCTVGSEVATGRYPTKKLSTKFMCGIQLHVDQLICDCCQPAPDERKQQAQPGPDAALYNP
jgi:ankyrin repeat protein